MLTKKREYLNTDAWHQFFPLSVFTGMTKDLSGFVIPAPYQVRGKLQQESRDFGLFPLDSRLHRNDTLSVWTQSSVKFLIWNDM